VKPERLKKEEDLKEGWGTGVMPRLTRGIANDMPKVNGFLERNIKRMLELAPRTPGIQLAA